MTVFLCHGVLSRAFLQQSSVSTSMAGCPVGPLLQHGHGLPSPLTGLQANTARVALLVSNQQGRLVLTPSSPRGSLRGTVNTRHSCEWPASGLAADEGDRPYVAWPIFLASLSVSWSPAEGYWFAQGCLPPSRTHVGLAQGQQFPCPLGQQNQAP